MLIVSKKFASTHMIAEMSVIKEVFGRHKLTQFFISVNANNDQL
jgi:hypothetical protein